METLAKVVPAALTRLAAGAMVGEYRVERLLGEGGMASVFGAVHPLIGKRAAIKVMSPALSRDAEAVARFVREAQAVNRIGHPNIVDVFSFGQLPDGRSYFVMEWLRGETLYERLWRQRRLALPDVIHVLEQIGDALEAAHDNGIVHRDLKPANVFLATAKARPDRVKLLDFGVAKLVHADAPPPTTRETVLGTPEYIAPEQARGRDVDARADLYSLGVMAYEMVLGRLPFLSDTPERAIHMHLTAAPPRPRILWPAIPPSLEAVLLQLLAKDPAARPSLAELRAVLTALTPASDRLNTPPGDRAALDTAAPSLESVPTQPLAIVSSTVPSLPRATSSAIPPSTRSRRLARQRDLGRIMAVAATFFLMLFLGYRPIRASRPPARPVEQVMATLAPPPETPPPVAGAHTRTLPVPLSAAHAHKRRIHSRAGDYLLNPFASH